MNHKFKFATFLIIALSIVFTDVHAQDSRPELMYFRFDEAGQTVTPNRAVPATAVTPQGNVGGALSMGNTGQWGSALVASGGGVANRVSTGWTTNLSNGPWTISMWLNNVSGNTFGYYFGDPSAGSFRCFNAGAAGTNNLLLRGPFGQVQVTGVSGGPNVVHFVYDNVANQIRAYKNGVLNRTVNQGSVNINGSGGQFGVGAYSGGGGSGSFPNGALMDEFRIYNRALSASEIADTWDKDVDCFIPDGEIGWDFVDQSGTPAPFVYTPGTTYLKYFVNYPAGASPVSIKVDFYSVPADVLSYTTVLNDTKLDGVNLNNMQAIPIPPTLPAGIYRTEVTFNTKNSCDVLFDYPAGSKALFVLEQGTSICLVWPGDNNNDGVVNFGDRKALTNYIHEANLRSEWLLGPARYRADAGSNPLSYLAWEAQPAIPWQTPEGCYMDTDGNGTINNFDFIAQKMNWMRTHGAGSNKDRSDFTTETFDLSANFPNPFNPSTNINFSVPERSYVKISVLDMLGREVATLVDGIIDSGVRTAHFDATNLNSGNYIATASMRGIESGLEFTKTIRMTLSK
jgi:concanavalin A-like lectin/glucanase superfamily protein